jgi:hypothetical protein
VILFYNQIIFTMNDSQMNWLRMFRKVKGVSIENSAITDKYPPIVASFNTFGALVDEIELVSAADSRSTKGTYEQKLEKKEAMALEAAELAAGGLALAKDKGDTELLAVLDISYSEMRYGDEQTAVGMATTIHDELSELGAELENYLVSAEDIAALKEAIDAYKAMLEDSGGQESVARTRQLAGLFKKANDHLNDHLDKLVMRIRRKEPVFYDTYQNARVIIDLGKGRKEEAPIEATM